MIEPSSGTPLSQNAGSSPATGHRLGPRRLSLLCGSLCVVLMALVLLIYGAPHNPIWWAIMALILIATVAGPRLLLPAVVDWVIDGYRRDLAR